MSARICYTWAMVDGQEDTILFSVDSLGIATLMVNRPRARNALNWEAQDRFVAVIEAVRAAKEVRALIITGRGERAFVSGADLKEHAGHPELETAARLLQTMRKALDQVMSLSIPVIAAVNGEAVGGGCEIVTACDLRVASRHAGFAFGQVKIGLTTGWGGTERLIRQIGSARALDLLLTGRRLDAKEALELGLIHRIASQGESAVDAANDLARSLIKLPKDALAAVKQLVYGLQETSLNGSNRLESQLFTGLWSSTNHAEALSAFQEKRPPIFDRRG